MVLERKPGKSASRRVLFAGVLALATAGAVNWLVACASFSDSASPAPAQTDANATGADAIGAAADAGDGAVGDGSMGPPDAASGDAGFSPANVSFLTLWLAPDSVVSDGGVATGWKDKSTAHNDFSVMTGCAAPGFSGGSAPRVVFDGATQCFTKPTVLGGAAAGGRTIFVVGQVQAFGNNNAGQLFFQGSPSDDTMNPVNQIGIEGDRASFVGGTPAVDGFSAYVAAGRFLTNAPFQSALGVHVLRVNPITTGVPTNGFLTYRYNGLPTTLSAPMKSPGPRSATATPAPTETGIGTYHDQSVRLYGHVDIAEVVFYADGLDDPSLLAVEKYLLMKHKIP